MSASDGKAKARRNGVVITDTSQGGTPALTQVEVPLWVTSWAEVIGATITAKIIVITKTATPATQRAYTSLAHRTPPTLPLPPFPASQRHCLRASAPRGVDGQGVAAVYLAIENHTPLVALLL